MYICKSLASLYLETRNEEERLSRARELSGNFKRKLENSLKNLNARIQGIETMCVPSSDLENLRQEMAPLEEALRVMQEDIKMISENLKKVLGKSFEPENSAMDDTTERRASTQHLKFGLADRTKKDDGQKNGESQTREAATMDGAEIQLLYHGKLILHNIV